MRGDADYSTSLATAEIVLHETMDGRGGRRRPPAPTRGRSRERGAWQRRFYEHNCRDDEDLKRCIDYIHINPVKHRLVDRAIEWPWSSFHRYVRLGEYSSDRGATTSGDGDEH